MLYFLFNPGMFDWMTQFTADVQGPFEWLTSHLHLIGWPVVVYATYLATRTVSKIDSRFAQVEANFVTIIDHLPKLGVSVQELNETMKEVSSDLRAYFSSQPPLPQS